MAVELALTTVQKLRTFVLAVVAGLAVTSSGYAEGVTVARGKVCEGLDQVACCSQVAAVYTFRATGDQLSKRSRLVVDLSCKVANHRLPKHSCRQLLISRGLSTVEAAEECESKGLAARCSKQDGCRACAKDLGKLGYRDAQGFCYAATWTEPTPHGYRL